MQELHVFTDGSCIGNPGPGGWGIIVRGPKGEIEMDGGEMDTTNNRMEMTAALKAMEYLHQNGLEGYVVNIYSDSSILIKTFTEGWKKKSNTDIWAEIEKVYAELLAKGNTFKWHWVKGHAGHKENERVDDLAREYALRLKSRNK